MKQMFRANGTIPIFSGNVHTPFGYVKQSNIRDFNHSYILWGIDDACFDFELFSKGTQFATTDHTGAIKILDDSIMPEYLLYELRAQKQRLDFGWSVRPSMEVMQRGTVDIPITQDGCFDFEEQKRVAEKYINIEKVKLRLRQISEYLQETVIAISDKEIGRYRTICIGDDNFFKVDNGERIRRKDIQRAKGDIPVYSASIFEDEVLGYVSDRIKEVVKEAKAFEGINLTANADGSDYSVYVRQNRFYANDVCNVLTVSSPEIDSYYLMYELRTQIYKKSLDYSFKLYKKKLRTLSVRIPVDNRGQIDTIKQRQIASQHDLLNKTRNKILAKLRELGNSTITLP
jgi:hypothetical protein